MIKIKALVEIYSDAASLFKTPGHDFFQFTQTVELQLFPRYWINITKFLCSKAWQTKCPVSILYKTSHLWILNENAHLIFNRNLPRTYKDDEQNQIPWKLPPVQTKNVLYKNLNRTKRFYCFLAMNWPWCRAAGQSQVRDKKHSTKKAENSRNVCDVNQNLCSKTIRWWRIGTY